MISWPAANEMRCVKPSIATVSPSRTRSAIASRIVATLEVLTSRLSASRRSARRSAGDLALVHRAGRVDLREDLARRGRRPAATASPKIRSAVAISASDTVSAGDIRTLDLPHSRTSRPRSKQAHWTSSACSAVSNSTPIIRPLPRTSRTSPSEPADAAARRPASACSPRTAALSTSPPSSSSIVASAAAQATGLPP